MSSDSINSVSNSGSRQQVHRKLEVAFPKMGCLNSRIQQGIADTKISWTDDRSKRNTSRIIKYKKISFD